MARIPDNIEGRKFNGSLYRVGYRGSDGMACRIHGTTNDYRIERDGKTLGFANTLAEVSMILKRN